jgi:hypothetical protein
MGLSPFLWAYSRSADQKIPRRLRNPKISTTVHKNPTTTPKLCVMNQDQIFEI